mmetsp:Transcript_12337/g.18948  ORF Transcript_12337/g.18948 Transcript_12337/m.18948 type:complete len:197 (-) Transcript_12337:75-665(-)
MCQVPSRWAVPKSLLLTCLFSFIVSSIPLAFVIFVHNPQIMKEMKEQAESTCVAPEIQPDVNEKLAEVQAVADAQRDQLLQELGRFQTANRELREQIKESKKELTYSDCEIELAKAKGGFKESYRRFEIVKEYFDKCKHQTTMLGKVLIDAEAEIKNLTKRLTTCNIINHKMEAEMLIAERKKNPQGNNRTTVSKI